VLGGWRRSASQSDHLTFYFAGNIGADQVIAVCWKCHNKVNSFLLGEIGVKNSRRPGTNLHMLSISTAVPSPDANDSVPHSDIENIM
jgi:hypothetical protein